VTTALITSESSMAFANELLCEQQKALTEAQRILDFAKAEGVESLATAQEKKIGPIRQRLVPLAMGYLPVSAQGGFNNFNETCKWAQYRVKRAMATAPAEVKEALEEAKKTDAFSSFSVTGGVGADPILVGNAGGWRFFIGSWVPMYGGHSLGLRFIPKLLQSEGK